MIKNPAPSTDPGEAAIIEDIVGERTDYTGSPVPVIFLSMLKINHGLMTILPTRYLSYSDSKPKITIIYNIYFGVPISAIGYEVLLFCKIENRCLKPSSKQILSGEADYTLNGLPVALLGAVNNRTHSLGLPFDEFPSFTPKYYAIGVTNMHGENFVYVRASDISERSITLTFVAMPSTVLYLDKNGYLD